MSSRTETVHALEVSGAHELRLRTLLNERSAAPISLILALLVGLGDYVTGADVAFTLLYLLPIGIATWYRGRAWSLTVCIVCGALWLSIAIASVPPQLPRELVLLWNLIGEAGVFIAFAAVLRALRARIDLEVHGRESAIEQLRHAERLTTVGMLASGIAHELGTPLNVIAGRASLIASERVAGAEARSSASIIVEQAGRMTAIIRGLLDFARRGGTRRTPVDVDRLARETVALLQPLASRRGCKVQVAAGPPVVASINGAEIQQVLTNLLMNAVQAMGEGGSVEVSIDVGPVAERPQNAEPSRSYVAIHVRDHGVGIPAEVLSHVFDPFFTTKDVGEGTGLGLSVAFGIVRDHGGWIAATSRVGEGSEFVVYLPQSAAP